MKRIQRWTLQAQSYNNGKYRDFEKYKTKFKTTNIEKCQNNDSFPVL